MRTAEESGAALYLVSDADLASLTDTVTPQGLVAVCTAGEVSLSDVVAGCAAPRRRLRAGT